ncbi:MAG: hypothetical protein K0S46_2204 [Moraxellaceae bacterium]|jgi:hypothetical protein|nr:hypothetical protein [Moraxellaceae bacterium]
MNSKHPFKRELMGLKPEQLVAMFAPGESKEEIYDKDLYYRGTLPLAGGTAEVQMFHANQGTLETTNIAENGRMPVNRHQLVEALGLTLVGASGTESVRVADVNTVADKGVLEIEVDGTIVFRGGPLRNFIKQTALTKIDTTSGDTGQTPFILNNPILLQAGKTYAVRIKFPGTGSPATTADVAYTMELLGQEIQV